MLRVRRQVRRQTHLIQHTVKYTSLGQVRAQEAANPHLGESQWLLGKHREKLEPTGNCMTAGEGRRGRMEMVEAGVSLPHYYLLTILQGPSPEVTGSLWKVLTMQVTGTGP